MINNQSIYLNGKPITHMVPDFGMTPNSSEDVRKKMGSLVPKNARAINESVNGDIVIDETDIKEFDIIRGKLTSDGKRVKYAQESDIKVVNTDEEGAIVYTEVVPAAVLKDTGVPKKENAAQYQQYEFNFVGWGYERIYGKYVHTEEVATITGGKITLKYQLTDKSDVMLLRIGENILSEDLFSVTAGSTGGTSEIQISSLFSTTGKKAKVVYITKLTAVPVE
ncbi:hypothetical protein [Paenibacillus contaminans]|uniref:Uncharacterized protein n=1 Tax=Paenibacillus contaminans TaxID=450362 RepID=A0A329MTN0_9BACL|nr:hypothetical protein [Paenibacillus contaminans]RAV22678.1 hypothetical protein DQG23_00205 [Paenibacillus contaminans]